jgi:hypothetical protein
MLIFTEGGKPEIPENSPRNKGENQQQTQLTYNTESGNRTRVTVVVRGEHSPLRQPIRPEGPDFLGTTPLDLPLYS